jgi:hypothetical protein
MFHIQNVEEEGQKAMVSRGSSKVGGRPSVASIGEEEEAPPAAFAATSETGGMAGGQKKRGSKRGSILVDRSESVAASEIEEVIHTDSDGTDLVWNPLFVKAAVDALLIVQNFTVAICE